MNDLSVSNEILDVGISDKLKLMSIFQSAFVQ